MSKTTLLFRLLFGLALLVGCSAPLTPVATPLTPVTISGFVFRDLNSDGTRDSHEPGEPDVTVSAYDVGDKLIATTKTDVNGNYALGNEPGHTLVRGANYRVVFSGWPAQLLPGPHGKDSNTEQQFVAGGATGVSFGLFSSEQFVPPEPTLNVVLTIRAATPSVTPTSAPMPTPTPASPAATPTSIYEGNGPAPDLTAGLDWFNVRRPLSLTDLRGKVVLLEFWTYGCIDSTEAIVQLKDLQDKYPHELVVIGVDSAKYPHETETENLRRIIERYSITYPIVNDKGYAVATAYNANVWPTFVLINPAGQYLGSRTGDLKYDQLDYIIGQIVQDFDSRQLIDRSSLESIVAEQPTADTPLRFPGAILADEAQQRLFIADSKHNRIVMTDLSGEVQDVIGNGSPTLHDGDYKTASFFRPQGMTLAGANTLYVADAGNHAIRRVDLVAKTVETVAGTGQLSDRVANNGPALALGLSSPSDVKYVDNLIYIAAAGQHQLWVYDQATQQLELFAGTGVEQLTDGPLLDAALYQPDALATDGTHIYFADSQSNTVRQADTDLAGVIRTIAGKGFNDFGDVDGTGAGVRLQHPASIVYQDGLLYVADTYNNKIKTIDPKTGESRTFVGTGQSGWKDGAEPLFDEPNGLSVTPHYLYVADTNNHAIRVVDLTTKAVSTLILTDPDGLLTRH